LRWVLRGSVPVAAGLGVVGCAWINFLGCAWINFAGMDEVVHFRPTSPKSTKLIHAADVGAPTA
jgi:hypothetical protein